MRKNQSGGRGLLTAAAIVVLLAGIVVLAGCPADAAGSESSPTVTKVTVTGQTAVAKGSTNILYTATVTGTGSYSNGVDWSVDGSPTGVSITSDGKLTVSNAASTGTIKVRADSTQSGYTDKTGDLEVTIEEPTGTVTGINVTGSTSVAKGSTGVEYTATVSGTGLYSTGVAWSVDSTPTGVNISADGKLSVDSGANTGTIKVRATSTQAGYTDKTGYLDVTITGTPSETDFKIKANAESLGLSPGSNYASAGALISAMDTRASNAATTYFYNPSINGTSVESNSYGLINRDNVNSGAPAMAWIIYGNDLIIHGNYDTGSSIKFDIVVINTADGIGWKTSYTKSTSGIYTDSVSISSITDSYFSAKSELSGYKVYIVVRETSALSGIDLNSFSYDRNVIVAYPYPY
jgi:hypothetical protein